MVSMFMVAAKRMIQGDSEDVHACVFGLEQPCLMDNGVKVPEEVHVVVVVVVVAAVMLTLISLDRKHSCSGAHIAGVGGTVAAVGGTVGAVAADRSCCC